MSMVCTPLLKELGCDSNLLAWSLLLEFCEFSGSHKVETADTDRHTDIQTVYEHANRARKISTGRLLPTPPASAVAVP
jgi:hypothetical protein